MCEAVLKLPLLSVNLMCSAHEITFFRVCEVIAFGKSPDPVTQRDFGIAGAKIGNFEIL